MNIKHIRLLYNFTKEKSFLTLSYGLRALLWISFIVSPRSSFFFFFFFFSFFLVFIFIISFKMDLKLCTFNCCSLKKNIDLVRELTSKCFDIIFLQETLVTKDRLGDLAFID